MVLAGSLPALKACADFQTHKPLYSQTGALRLFSISTMQILAHNIRWSTVSKTICSRCCLHKGHHSLLINLFGEKHNAPHTWLCSSEPEIAALGSEPPGCYQGALQPTAVKNRKPFKCAPS